MKNQHVNQKDSDLEKDLDLKFVYFDLGNILITFDRDAANRNISELMTVSATWADEVLHTSGLQNDLEHGRIDDEAFAEIVRGELGRPDVTTEAIMDAISDMFTPIESMRAAVDAVRNAGLGVGVLSNTCHAHWKWVHSRDWAVMSEPFDATVLSCDAGSMKPDPVIYEIAEATAKKLTNAAPHQILFLDDRIENVEAARARSWLAEQCLGGEQAFDVLSRYGIVADMTVDTVDP